MMRSVFMLVTGAMAMLGVALLASGCGGGDVVGSGDPATKDYDLDGFTRLDVSHAFKVGVTRGDAYEVKVTVDDDLLESLDVSLKGDTLRIGLEGVPPNEHTTRIAAVTLPGLTAVELSGASEASVEGFSSSGDLDLVLEGASSLVFTDVRAGDARFDLSGTSKMTGVVWVGDTWMDLRGASSVDLEGSGAAASLDASGASHLRLGDFAFKSAEVTLSGASTATLDVTGALDADLSGASTLRYYSGSPKLGKIETTGASQITPCLTPAPPGGPVPVTYPSIQKGSSPPDAKMEGPPMSPVAPFTPSSGDEPGVHTQE